MRHEIYSLLMPWIAPDYPIADRNTLVLFYCTSRRTLHRQRTLSPVRRPTYNLQNLICQLIPLFENANTVHSVYFAYGSKIAAILPLPSVWSVSYRYRCKYVLQVVVIINTCYVSYGKSREHTCGGL